MQYLLTEEEFRALKAESDAKIQAEILAKDYRNRLGKAVLEGLKPFLRFDRFDESTQSHRILSRLQAVFLSVPVIPPEDKV